MLELWGMELLKGTAKLFMNPLFYWTIIFVTLISMYRIKKERLAFGIKLNPLFSEMKHTWLLSIGLFLLLSIVSLLFGGVFTLETISILFIVTAILSLIGSAGALSSAYVLGVTYIVFLLLPITNLVNMDYYLDEPSSLIAIFTTLSFLTGILLFVEGWMIGSSKNKPIYPEAKLGDRGVWLGEQYLRKLMFVPFVAFMPLTAGEGVAPFFPYFEYNGEMYSLIIIPILFGYNFRVRGDIPEAVNEKLSKSIKILSMIVLLFTGLSFLYFDLSLAAILLALIGRFVIGLRFKLQDRTKTAYFRPLKQGIRILALIPDGPADRLGIKAGECILRVNGAYVTDADEFYVALQNSGAFFKLEVLDFRGEKRFITSAFYEEDHHELGVVFPGESYRS